jgi:hypothetical protein
VHRNRQPSPSVGSGDGAAEDEGAGAGVLVPGSPEALHAVLGLHGGGEGRGIEAAVAPGDVGVVDVVAHAVVGDGHEAAARDAHAEVGAVGDEVVEEGEHVAVVGAVGGGREPEQEGGVEGVEDAAVGGRVGVVASVWASSSWQRARNSTRGQRPLSRATWATSSKPTRIGVGAGALVIRSDFEWTPWWGERRCSGRATR